MTQKIGHRAYQVMSISSLCHQLPIFQNSHSDRTPSSPSKSAPHSEPQERMSQHLEEDRPHGETQRVSKSAVSFVSTTKYARMSTQSDGPRDMHLCAKTLRRVLQESQQQEALFLYSARGRNFPFLKQAGNACQGSRLGND